MQKRADALDALRGLAILLMILSGSIPFGGMLPDWMYHAQLPPPTHKFNPNLPGLTWVDLVFPFFLFAMGTAFPFALSKKIKSGVSNFKISLQILERGLLLAGFAIFIQHFKPYALNSSPTNLDWLIGILGFLLLFALYLRFPNSVNKKIVYAVRIIGIIITVLLLANLSYPNDSSFSLGRSDIIILVLANTAFFGSLIWVFTKDNLILRLGILGFLIAFRLTQSIDGSWNNWLWNFSPFPWLYKLYYLQYLFIVIPGTIIGDVLYKWFNSDSKQEIYDSKKSAVLITLISFTVIICNLIFLQSRMMILNLLVNIALLAAIYFIIKNQNESLIKTLFNWGAYWVLLGLTFEAFEGGIKKDQSTLSYYFLTTGLAIFCYIFLSTLIDYFKQRKIFGLIISSGQNPMIAYVAGSLFWMPVLELTNLSSVLNLPLVNPWLGFLKGIIFTFLVAVTAAFFTSKKLFWRT
jgi:predicted acyltransferase